MPTKRPTPHPAAAPTAGAANIANIERMIAVQTPVLAKKAPKQLQDMKTLLRELKAGKPPSPASQQMLRSLVIWQLDAKRDEYALRLKSLDSSPQSAKSRRALENMLRVLEEAKKAMTTPNPQAMRAVEMASTRAKASLQEAQAHQKAVKASPDATPPVLKRARLQQAPAPMKRAPLVDPDATPPPAPSRPAVTKAAPKVLGAFRPPPAGVAVPRAGVKKK